MDLMFAHKSLGLLMGGAVAARVGMRLGSKVPALPEGNALMHLAANASHVAMYAFMLIMPATGVVMGYYGGAVRVLPAPTMTAAPLSASLTARDGLNRGCRSSSPSCQARPRTRATSSWRETRSRCHLPPRAHALTLMAAQRLGAHTCGERRTTDGERGWSSRCTSSPGRRSSTSCLSTWAPWGCTP